MKLPPGYTGVIADLGPRVVTLHGPAVHEMCPRYEESCKPWVDDEHPTITARGYSKVTASARVDLISD